MSWDAWCWAALVLAAVPFFMGVINVFLYRIPPKARGEVPPVSVLVPARNEEARIVPTLETILASENVILELIVADDHSEDGTADIIKQFAARDNRVQLVHVPELPEGWGGKMHACHFLSTQATHEHVVFVDADVTIAPDALSRLSHALKECDAAMVSGLPLQETRTFWEKVLIPQIHVLLLGYLPFIGMRMTTWAGFGAGCGQLVAVHQSDYRACGGHEAIKHLLHDALQLSRLFRRHGMKTDMVDLTKLAATRMYGSFAEIWSGFIKNAHEGIATPVALPIWTVLLAGGHILPFVLLLVGLAAGLPLALALWACVLIALFRILLALRYQQSFLGVVLHPLGVAVMVWLQWAALFQARSGKKVSWRGRNYAANS
ncbi:MAG: glycosyltransferase [Hyphomicrobiales bacterium]